MIGWERGAIRGRGKKVDMNFASVRRIPARGDKRLNEGEKEIGGLV